MTSIFDRVVPETVTRQVTTEVARKVSLTGKDRHLITGIKSHQETVCTRSRRLFLSIHSTIKTNITSKRMST